jgi:predicted RecA/RadA family phage recombinase
MLAKLVNSLMDTVKILAGATVEPGAIAVLGNGLVGVSQNSVDAASGDYVEFAVRGVFDVASASATTFAVDDDVYFDVSAGKAVTTPGDVADFYIGRAVEAKVDGDLWVRVALNESWSGRLRDVTGSRGVTIAYNSTAENEVVSADDNPAGLQLLLVVEVTTTIAGASQDQMIVNVYDEDDNSLGSVTTVDGGAAAGLTYSAWCKKLPAGKGAYIKPSQVASGSGAAGAVRARVVAVPW